MDGNQQQQKEALKGKVEKWVSKIQTKQLTTTKVWLLFQRSISKGIGYLVVATILSKCDCNKIMKSLLQMALPAIVNQKFIHTSLYIH